MRKNEVIDPVVQPPLGGSVTLAHVLTMDEARRIASNIVKLPTLLGKGS